MLVAIVAMLLCDSARRVSAGCAPSETPLSEDLNRRQCLRQCELTKGGLTGDLMVQPPFEEWEAFCYETSLQEDWDKECEDFYCCLYGCEVFGSDRSQCSSSSPQNRPSVMDKVRIGNSEKSKRCDIQKCRAWCARAVFDTCKEIQYKESCRYDTAGLFRCDVECGGALRKASQSSGLLMILLLLHGTALQSIGL